MTPPRIPSLASLALLFAACAAPPPDYTAYLQHMPRSILVLPPVNDSIEANAGAAFLSTVTQAVAERGYYVFPIAVVETLMRQNGAPAAADMHAVPREKLREVFGADAALYVHIVEWGTTYQVLASPSRVTVDCKLVDLRSGIPLWAGRQTAVSQPNGGGNAIGMLIGAVVEAVASSVSDPCPNLARLANQTLFSDSHHGLLLGPHHPGFAEDQERRRAAAAPKQP